MPAHFECGKKSERAVDASTHTLRADIIHGISCEQVALHIITSI